MYRTEAELIKEMGNFTAKDINKKDFKKLADYELNRKNYLRNHFHKPTMGRFAGDLFMLDDGGVYKLSLSKRLFDGVNEWPIGKLTKEQKHLPFNEVWNDTLLVERIESGWTPETDDHKP